MPLQVKHLTNIVPSNRQIPALSSRRFVVHNSHLGFLDVLLLNAGSADAVSTVTLLKIQRLVHFGIVLRPMNILLKDRIGLNSLEFGLETIQTMAVGATIGATTGIGEIVTVVLRLVTWKSPDIAILIRKG